jgi:hypothetical protein
MPEKNKLHNFIVERLMASDNIDDIVLEICQDGKISWNEAEALVRQVEEEQRTKIERGQSPILVIWALGTFVVGIALVMYSSYTAAELSHMALKQRDLDFIGTMLEIIRAAPYLFWTGIFGAAMITGSLVGMRKVWSAWLNG